MKPQITQMKVHRCRPRLGVYLLALYGSVMIFLQLSAALWRL